MTHPLIEQSGPDDLDVRVDEEVDDTTGPSRGAARSRRQLVLWAIVAVLTIWLVVARRADLAAATRAVARADPLWLLGGAVTCALVIVNLAALQSRSQALLGVRRTFRRTVRLTAGAHALDLATKSGGMAGAVRFGADARQHGQSAPNAAAGCVLAELCTHLGFTTALLFAIPIAARAHRLTPTDLVGLAIYVLLTMALLLIIVCAVRSRAAVARITVLPHTVRNAFRRLRRMPRAPHDHSDRVADELHLALSMARVERQRLRPIAIHGLLWPVLGALLLGCACAAVGVHLTPSAVLITYCLATTFSIIGVLPGGLGFAEVSMGATLHAFGVDAGHALAVIAIYRVFDLWLPLLAGAATLRRRSPHRRGQDLNSTSSRPPRAACH